MVTEGGAPLVFQLTHQRVEPKNAVYDDARFQRKMPSADSLDYLVQAAGSEQTSSPGGRGGGSGHFQFSSILAL